jgi:stage II sporulation protein D
VKRLLPLLFSALVVFCIPSITNAADSTTTPAPEVKKYPNQVSVSVQTAPSLTISLNNSYQLTNNQTGESMLIPSNTVLSVKKSSSSVAVSYTGFSQSSTSGFLVQELDSQTVTSIAALSNGHSYRGSFSLKVNGNNIEVINNLDIEDYVKGVVPNEMAASWPTEAVKAQAIASRSYALATKSTLSSTVSSQVYRGYSSEATLSNAAVDATAGETVKFAGKTIQAFFYAASGGKTANYGDVWNSKYASSYPYLISVDDPYENSEKYTNWTVSVQAADILKKFGFSSGTKLYNVSINPTGKNGEVSGVTVKTSAGDKTITGNENTIRGLFPFGTASSYNMIYSNWFTLGQLGYAPVLTNLSLSVQTASGTVALTDLRGQTVQTASGTMTLDDSSSVAIQTSNGIVSPDDTSGQAEIASVTLSGHGFGHRIGMSQYGAKGYALHNWTAENILKHYFPGTTVTR